VRIFLLKHTNPVAKKKEGRGRAWELMTKNPKRHT
jgi:hypothetical protein